MSHHYNFDYICRIPLDPTRSAGLNTIQDWICQQCDELLFLSYIALNVSFIMHL